MAGRYQISGRGPDLGLRVWGPDPGACLAAAVAGLAASLADVGPADATASVPVSLDTESADELLVELLDEVILRLDADGQLATDLRVQQASATRLRGELGLVPLDAVEVHGVAPKAATWHDVRLAPAGDGWEGEIMIDL